MKHKYYSQIQTLSINAHGLWACDALTQTTLLTCPYIRINPKSTEKRDKIRWQMTKLLETRGGMRVSWNATRESVRLIIIQAIYSQRAVRLKTVKINIAIFAVKISFSQRYVLITFLFSNLIKEILNNFLYISHFTYVKFPLYLCMFWVLEKWHWNILE
jgi:hypothetical protein